MVFYEIHFDAKPQIKFALSTTTNKYKNIWENRLNLIEIAILDGADTIHEISFGTFTVPSKSMFLNMPDICCKSRQIGSDNLTINTVAMMISDMRFIRHMCGNYNEAAAIINSASSRDAIFLPLFAPLDVEECLHLTSIIKRLINYYISNSPADNCHCLAKWFELVGTLSSMFCNQVNENTTKAKFSSTYFYTKKAKKLIAKNFCNNITIADIAAPLGISPNYLSTIFKSDTGMTINEYINVLRVQKIRNLLQDKKMTLDRIAAEVGLQDIRYMQRLFKKHYGISMQRCRLIDNAISLYHSIPWDVESLTRDLYKYEEETAGKTDTIGT
ncbi:MAG: helix-turn-helix transcriptional regulator [Eubacteriales bacterium]|jgi:AraC-like DNA-binding protein